MTNQTFTTHPFPGTVARPPIIDEHGVDRRAEYEAAADRHLAAWWEIQRRADERRAAETRS